MTITRKDGRSHRRRGLDTRPRRNPQRRGSPPSLLRQRQQIHEDVEGWTPAHDATHNAAGAAR
jgi:hypothetical protein